MPWRCHHPSNIPRDKWLAYLDTIPDASPYLLPEWSLFWQDVWPKARGEAWTDGVAIIPIVHRRFWGFGWRYAQPYGTPSAPISESAFREILDQSGGDRIVEMSICPAMFDAPSGWHRRLLTQRSWVIETSGTLYANLAPQFSGSHRRNIEKGHRLALSIVSPTDVSETRTFIKAWKDWAGALRFIREKRWAEALYTRFATTGALHWRTAWMSERPVAGTIFLVHKSIAVSVDTVVDRDPAFRGAGHYLMAESIRELMEKGVTRIDLGGVPGGSAHAGLDEFKSGWGATQETLATAIYRRGWYQRIRG